MAIKKVDIVDTTNKAEKIIDDFWGRHNLTTRFITISSTILLIVIVIADILGVKIPNFDTLFKTLADMVLYITIIIILGVNGAAKIFKIIKGV